VRRTIDIDERRETVRMPLRSPVTGVDVDPEAWVLKDVEAAPHTER
jgi:hypothetical protein